MLIEPDTDGMHQNDAQQAIAQMPHVSRPQTFEFTAIRQLSKDGINAIAHPTQHWTFVGGSGWREWDR